MPVRDQTIAALIHRSRLDGADRSALLSLDDAPITYDALAIAVDDIRGDARQLGVRPGDRVAMALPDGLDAAVAFLGLASSCALAPFNPRLTRDELSRLLHDLQPKALVLPPGPPGAAAQAAVDAGIPVWTFDRPGTDVSTGRRWQLKGAPAGAPATETDPGADQTALLLFTSGTTSRPKLVPLTQANLCASARSIAATLRLGPTDRCLNVMPLFHIHGLIGGLLASLSAGASVICTPGFSGAGFLQWLDDTQPTWYTAVPTMHAAVLAERARRSRPVGARLRFIRSSSSALPPQVMSALESAFGAPVIEAYGMTEASHQMATNPLPPVRRKPGSVGLPAGTEIAILDAEGAEPLPPGRVGEIAVRGAGVMAGYVDNPEATAAAFSNGWFRTGDQGSLDEDGYLTITGRLKELINRGGEKIAPREVDDALTAHPAVAQAVTFAIPDERLGEDVAAAVVLRAGAIASASDLRQHVADRLAYFKVPRRLVIVEALPTGATGKVQRRMMAAALGLNGPPDLPRARARAARSLSRLSNAASPRCGARSWAATRSASRSTSSTPAETRSPPFDWPTACRPRSALTSASATSSPHPRFATRSCWFRGRSGLANTPRLGRVMLLRETVRV